ncbi:hypothetical protein H311_04327, partial [Anncaliia algerae PRA109]
MIGTSRIYTFFFIFYFIKIIGFVVYFKFLIKKFIDSGIKTLPISLYLVWMFFISSFISFILLTNVFVSQKVQMYIPYIIIEGNLILVSVSLLPFTSRGYYFVAFICPQILEYFLILYAFNKDIKTARYVEVRKLGLNILGQR